MRCPKQKEKKNSEGGGGGRGAICVCDAQAGGGETGCSGRRLPSTRRATMVRPARMVCGRVAGGRALFPRHLPSAAGDSPRSLRRLRTAVSTSSYNQVSLRQLLLSPRARPSSRSSANSPPLSPPITLSRHPKTVSNEQFVSRQRDLESKGVMVYDVGSTSAILGEGSAGFEVEELQR